MRGGTVGIVAILALGLLCAPLATDAQPLGNIPKVGWLDGGREDKKAYLLHAAFLQGLRGVGLCGGAERRLGTP